MSIAKQAVASLNSVEQFTGQTGNRRTQIIAVSTAVVTVPLGDHSHLMVENLGANTLQLVASTGLAVDWIEAAGAKVLDGDTEPFIYFQCAAGGTTVRITVWGNKNDFKR